MGRKTSLTKAKPQGTKLQVFSGKEANLNHLILLLIEKEALIPYDVWLLVRVVKNFRHTPYKSICRRVRILDQQGWIVKKGERPTRPRGTANLYGITLKAQAVLRIAEKPMDEFLESASEQKLHQLIETLQ